MEPANPLKFRRPAADGVTVMRLLSFLSEIERALVTGRPDSNGMADWESTRMVNFQQGLARLSINPKDDRSGRSGNIFLQAFTLANGSQCLKASLNWNGSDAVAMIAVYSTPTLNWRNEAARIALEWSNGPQAAETFSSEPVSLLAAAAAAS